MSNTNIKLTIEALDTGSINTASRLRLVVEGKAAAVAAAADIVIDGLGADVLKATTVTTDGVRQDITETFTPEKIDPLDTGDSSV